MCGESNQALTARVGCVLLVRALDVLAQPINRFTKRRTGRTDPTTGEEKFARINPPQGGFRDDPFSRIVYALEDFDESTQNARKAAILSERVIVPRAPRLGADTPEDALAICLDTYGEARLDEVARLLGTSSAQARAQLDTLVFDEPGTGRIVPAAEYLSGNVRAKRAQARTALEDDPRFATNVEALTAVLPPDRGLDGWSERCRASSRRRCRAHGLLGG